MDSFQTNKLLAKLSTRGYASLNQFAVIAGISYPTALKLAKTGKIETVPVGGITRVYVEEIERFLREGNRKTDEGSNSPHSFT